MPVDVVVPEVGEVGMEVTLVSWLRAEGDDVTRGEPLFQVDTQKTLLDVEAVATGRLVDVKAGPGDLVEPHQVIARLVAEGEVYAADDDVVSPDPISTAVDSAPSAESVQHLSADRTQRQPASPRARRVAAELGVELPLVTGTGPGGLITETDVTEAAAGHTSLQANEPPAAPAERVRRAVAEMTTRSWTTVPHFYVRLDADITAGLEVAKPTPLILWAFARAIAGRPEAHVSIGADGTRKARESVDIGLLVDTPDGLLLPVIRGADKLDLAATAEAVQAAAERARAGRLLSDDLGPRSATISNLGMFAVDQFAGIVATPDTMLLSVGRAKVSPVWDGSAFQPRSVATLTLSADHRAMDGADAGRLLGDLEALLRDPSGTGS